jgi:BirA family biotin operon repressor/biotin-[acetyl-CoA-carboxylase] ligase
MNKTDIQYEVFHKCLEKCKLCKGFYNEGAFQMDELLEMLAKEPCVSGETMSKHLGITRAAVWKRIEALRSQGFVIESAGKRGYRLLEPTDSLLPVFLKKELHTAWAGQPPMIYTESMTSTNAVLKQAAESGAGHGTLALCEEQTQGRGRRGRSWVSPKGQGLWVSLLLRPNLPPAKAQLITLAANIALVRPTGNYSHYRSAMQIGIKKEEICELILQVGHYAGWPAISNAVRQFTAVLEEEADRKKGKKKRKPLLV